MVSIVCSTFNHEKYIAQTIGLYFQRAVSIWSYYSRHSSTDGIRSNEIIEWVSSYINVIAQPENFQPLKRCACFLSCAVLRKGIFIAYCEGDDYWVDPDKIQKQANFLLNNPRYSACFH